MDGKRLTEKATLRNNIREYIQQQIATGRFQAGDRVVETQLAKELHVSQAPVREAILELAAMGLLEERPYSGSFVRKLTLEDIEDIYNTRAFIDEYAARQAARRITAEQLAEMEALLREMDAAENARDFVEKPGPQTDVGEPAAGGVDGAVRGGHPEHAAGAGKAALADSAYAGKARGPYRGGVYVPAYQKLR